MIHCWADYRTEIDPLEDNNKTCLLEDGHDGPHEWTDDSQIRVTLAPFTVKAGDDDAKNS